MRSLPLVVLLAACDPAPAATDAGERADAPRVDAPDAFSFDAGPVVGEVYGEPGPHPVGNARIAMTDRTGARTLPVELWYPAVETARALAAAGQPMEAFEAGTANEASLAAMVAASPASCLRATMRSALDAEAAATPALLPVVVFSHCHACTRFDIAEVCERLASHGIVVAAPDHLGNTAWDEPPAAVGSEFLAVRASDVSSVLDRLLDASAAEVPATLRGRIDPARAAVMGHSFGAATTGLVVASDERFVAALAIAAPVRALGGIDAADLDVPYLFLLAQEDNSIGAAGNSLLRSDYAAVPGPAWLVEVADAGHWSFADIAGLGGEFTPGCAALDDRHPYLDNAEAREITSDVAMGFFAHTLLGDADGAAFLATAFWVGPARVASRP